MSARTASSTPRRQGPLALKLATLTPLSIDTKMSEKSQLPCIMVTPSSPVHDHDYKVFYFDQEKLQPGLFHQIRRTVWSPPSEDESPYGSSRSTWTAAKRVRFMLMVLACLFIALHLLALPKMETGLYDVFSTHSGSHQMDDSVALWEDWNGGAGSPTAAPPVASHTVHDELAWASML